MNNIIIKESLIHNMIYEIRGVQVMLDSDLAKLYGVETKRVNEAVRRNKNKFPERISFLLNDIESNFLVANCDQKNETRGGKYKNPRVFTEQGIYMLATILKSNIATQVTLNIMDAFVMMRKYIGNNLIEQKYINNLVVEDHTKLIELENSIKKITEKRLVNEVYFDGQIYDAYSKIIDIFNMSKNELIIIDGYADKTVLDMIKNLNVNVILISKSNNGLLTNLDIKKYNSQYNNLTIKYNNKFHDRYFILDKGEVYHCGASINHVGSKIFSINLLEDDIVKEKIIDYVNNI